MRKFKCPDSFLIPEHAKTFVEVLLAHASILEHKGLERENLSNAVQREGGIIKSKYLVPFAHTASFK